ncbi:HMBOX1 [Branchiostoma lanceolatum]|uniref:HMBOX1 protein n=2 Tax=Branchiostoma lanceolatum TaxID=7740 RepID=A0A8J9ZKM7_BRALA|nr:HMBOX1 [Branchiostoma lanceolatum]
MQQGPTQVRPCCMMGEPRYTIEQIDLLQRLRRTGLSKDEILQALETMERLDREHGSIVAPPVHACSNRTMRWNLKTEGEIVPAASPPVSSPQGALAANGTASPMDQSRPHKDCVLSEEQIQTEVEIMLNKNVDSVKEELRLFLSERRISQGLISRYTGISQSYLSQFLTQGLDMSIIKKRTLFTWYIREKFSNSPVSALDLTSAVPKAVRVADHVDDDHDWTPHLQFRSNVHRRGHRFNWPEACITIMEKYFEENQYPDEKKREEITNACNSVIQKPGVELPAQMLVNSARVYNWFANRRKDVKRRQSAGLTSFGVKMHNTLSPVPSSQSTPHHRVEDRGNQNTDHHGGNMLQEQGESKHEESHQDPVQVAVEMAAVNHAIMALVNQHSDDMDQGEEQEEEEGEDGEYS